MGFEINGPGLPPGGTTGQALLKASNVNYDVAWGANVVVLGGTEQKLDEVINDLVTRINNLESETKLLHVEITRLSGGQ